MDPFDTETTGILEESEDFVSRRVTASDQSASENTTESVMSSTTVTEETLNEDCVTDTVACEPPDPDVPAPEALVCTSSSSEFVADSFPFSSIAITAK